MTEPALPDRLRLQPGEERVLRIPSRGLSGYRWEVAVEGSAVAVGHDREPAGPAPGSAGDDLLTVRAIAAGDATITAIRRRAWGPPDPAAETVRIVVQVIDP